MTKTSLSAQSQINPSSHFLTPLYKDKPGQTIPEGTNGKFNIAMGEALTFPVTISGGSTGYDIAEYRWQKIVGDAAPGPGYEITTGPNKNYTFEDSGEYTVYCQAVDAIGATSNWVGIPMHVWLRPMVNNAPPQAAIDTGEVSWFDDAYVGVVGKPVRLMADGETGANDDQTEVVVEYIWDFDRSWDTVELTQSAGEVVSYTWNIVSLSDQIRCKAVTNYGVKSAEKLFKLKVYDTPRVNPGGPYASRANTPVKLSGILESSYPSASMMYQWRVNAATPEATFKCNWLTNPDDMHKGDYIQLTEAVNEQNGQIEYADLPLSDNWSITGEFWSGGGTGADAFYVYVWANATPSSEEQDRGQYSIAFDEYTDEIKLLRGSSPLTTVLNPVPLDNSQWRPFRVEFDRGEFKVYLDHQLKLEHYDGNHYEDMMNNPANNLFGFGARTGGRNNIHRARNMKWTTGDPVDTTTQGEAKYAWQDEGTYLAGFTAQVTTSEGIVLEETEFVEVKVEAGIPTARPGGPYRGGIAGGNFSPIQFEGNHPDFVEATDIGKITDWVWFLSDGGNGGLQLDGKDDYVIVEPMNDFPTTEMTVEFWMKSDDTTRAGTPISYAVDTNINHFMFYNYRNFHFRIVGARTGDTNVSANDGHWHHLAVTWSSSEYLDDEDNTQPAGTLKFYKDGIEVYTEVISAGESFLTGGALVLGQEQDAVGGAFDRNQAFEGATDDVRLWNHVRSGSEIREAMGRELIGDEQGLVLNWRFEEGQNTTVHDSTPYGYDGELIVTNDGDPEAPNNRWVDDGHPATSHGVWNPAYHYLKAGDFLASLKVRAESGKWSAVKSTTVEVVDGQIAGYVRAADLRTPVREVRLTLTSSHVDKNVLSLIAAADERLNTFTGPTGEFSLWTETDEEGYYSFEHIPLGSYRIRANKGEGDKAHEFEKAVQVTELTLDGPNQLAIDYVDLSVFPVGGRIVYSIQKNGADVLVEEVKVKAQPIGSTSDIEALPTTRSLSATGTNYNLPLFAGKYLLIAEKPQHDIRLAGTNPNDANRTPPDGYDANIGLLTIEDARTDVDFIDYTTRKLDVFVVDSGSFAMPERDVTISGNNGQAEGQSDEEGIFAATLNPGKYTVTVPGAQPETEEVDVTGEDQAIIMTIPVPIEIEIISEPPALIPREIWDELLEDEDIAAFMSEFGITKDNIPEGYLYYYPPVPIPHYYIIKVTANGHPVTGYTLTVWDEISQMTADPPTEKEIVASGDEAEVAVEVIGGLPKLDFDETDNPIPGEKFIRFQASKEKYQDSDLLETGVKVLGDLPKGETEQLIAIPNVNYTVLHDPPGDDSYSYLDDDAVIRGAIQNMSISFPDPGGDFNAIPVYPAPWSERDIEGFDDDATDLGDKGLLDTRGSKSEFGDDYDSAAQNYMANIGMRFGITAGKMGLGALAGKVLPKISMKLAKWAGPAAAIASYPLAVAFTFKDAAILKEGTNSRGYITPQIQYEVRPRQRMETPKGDTAPDLVGPGKGDIYIGEGWTLILRDHYRFGVAWNETEQTWEENSSEVKTYTIEQEEENQYMYTIRDIEQIISDLTASIETLEEGSDQREDLEDSKETWQNLLDYNRAYQWNRLYVDNAAKIALLEAKTDRTTAEEAYLSELTSVRSSIDAEGGDAFEAFKEDELTGYGYETLIFSGGPTFEYSRSISEGNFATYSVSSFYYDRATLGSTFVYTTPPPSIAPIPVAVRFEIGGGDFVGKEDLLYNEVQSGQQVNQTVGFVLHDDDVGDQLATHVYEDPRWGTPMFIQDLGSYTSDPWEPGTNKAVDITLELLEQPTGKFDYHEGAHYTIKLTYTGARYYTGAKDVYGRTLQKIDFALYAPQPDNEDNLTVRFNGTHEPYVVGLNEDLRTATIALSLYPPEKDKDNSGEKQYEANIMVQEVADQQIARLLALNPTFADLRAPRAVIKAPYDGERISPVFFPEEDPFKIEVVSEDTDLNSIQLQIRSKQPNGVWEPWRNLSGMLWEDGVANPDVVTVFDRLDRSPPRREFTFRWKEDAIKSLGVGEYALRAIATDQATRSSQPAFPGNVDIAPPSVVFLVDDAKPSVLNSVPDYQARESERIYRGELSITFTDDMRSTDFSDRTFYVMNLLDNNSKVAGYVSYSPALRKTVFVPIVPFQPNGFYRVEIKTDVDTDSDGEIDERGVHDLAGNPLDNAFMWTFRTTDAPFEPTWSMVFSVTDGTSTDANNYASVEYGALDEEDEKDSLAVPALASQLRMVFLNQDKVEFDRDIRPADGRLSHHWFFVIDNAQSGATVTIRYKPSIKLIQNPQYPIIRLVEFDQNGQVTNTIMLPQPGHEPQVNPDTGLIDPVEAYTYTNQGERSRYFRLDVQKVGFVAGTFEVGTSGWKFFSVPITPQRAEPFVNLGDDIDPFKLFQYDTGLSGYKIYPFDIGEVGLQTGHGYFTRLEANVEVDVGGSSNSDDVTLDLEVEGWHAIGNPFIKEVDVASLIVNDGSGEKLFDAAVAADLVEGTLYRWNIVTENAAFLSEVAISDSYQPVTSALNSGEFGYLAPWDACWLKTNQANLTLKIPAPDDLPNNPPMPDYLKPPMAPVGHAASLPVVNLPDAQFSLKLSLTSDFASDLTTTLGTHQNAQTGWDIFDQSEPPTLSKTVAVYFNHPDWGDDTALKNGAGGGGLYNRDYQPALKVGEQRTWKFTVYTDKQDAEMTLSWEKAIAQVPGDIMLYFRRSDEPFPPLKRGAGGVWQDMREVQSVDLISRSRITEIPFEVRAERFEMAPLSDVEVVAGEKQVTIKWAANDNPFIEGYTINRQKVSDASCFTFHVSRFTHQFLDTDVAEEATYTYQVIVHFKSGAELQSEPFTVTVLPVIKKTVLLQSYPNPFNPDVWIPYELETEATVKIEIYNAAGQLVHTLDLGMQQRGRYINRSKAAYWDGRTQVGECAASGLYFYVLKAGDFAATRRMAILK